MSLTLANPCCLEVKPTEVVAEPKEQEVEEEEKMEQDPVDIDAIANDLNKEVGGVEYYFV